MAWKYFIGELILCIAVTLLLPRDRFELSPPKRLEPKSSVSTYSTNGANLVPKVGLEPTTSELQIQRTTNCAIPAMWSELRESNTHCLGGNQVPNQSAKLAN